MGGGLGMCSFTPTKRGGGQKILSMLKGGAQQFWSSLFAEACIFSHIEKGGGGAKSFQKFPAKTVYSIL